MRVSLNISEDQLDYLLEVVRKPDRDDKDYVSISLLLEQLIDWREYLDDKYEDKYKNWYFEKSK